MRTLLNTTAFAALFLATPALALQDNQTEEKQQQEQQEQESQDQQQDQASDEQKASEETGEERFIEDGAEEPVTQDQLDEDALDKLDDAESLNKAVLETTTRKDVPPVRMSEESDSKRMQRDAQGNRQQTRADGSTTPQDPNQRSASSSSSQGDEDLTPTQRRQKQALAAILGEDAMQVASSGSASESSSSTSSDWSTQDSRQQDANRSSGDDQEMDAERYAENDRDNPRSSARSDDSAREGDMDNADSRMASSRGMQDESGDTSSDYASQDDQSSEYGPQDDTMRSRMAQQDDEDGSQSGDMMRDRRGMMDEDRMAEGGMMGQEGQGMGERSMQDRMARQDRDSMMRQQEERMAMGQSDRMQSQDYGQSGMEDTDVFVYTRTARMNPQALNAQRILDKDLMGPDGDEVAEVSDLIIDSQGKVTQAVVKTGGMLGLGENSYVVDFDQLNIQPGEDGDLTVSTSMAKSDIKQLERWDEDEFVVGEGGLTLASELRNAELALTGTDETVNIEDIVMNRMGDVRSVIVRYDDEDYAVPYDRVSVAEGDAEGGSGYTLNTSTADFAILPVYIVTPTEGGDQQSSKDMQSKDREDQQRQQ